MAQTGWRNFFYLIKRLKQESEFISFGRIIANVKGRGERKGVVGRDAVMGVSLGMLGFGENSS